jgi:hypothetical protein
MVAQVAVVAVGEHTPWPNADVEATQTKALEGNSSIPVVGILEDGEEVLWSVTGNLDVTTTDAEADPKLFFNRRWLHIYLSTEAEDHGARGEALPLLLHVLRCCCHSGDF